MIVEVKSKPRGVVDIEAQKLLGGVFGIIGGNNLYLITSLLQKLEGLLEPVGVTAHMGEWLDRRFCEPFCVSGGSGLFENTILPTLTVGSIKNPIRMGFDNDEGSRVVSVCDLGVRAALWNFVGIRPGRTG